MEPVVQSLALKGFRSLANVRIAFGNPTFLVGQNGAGKSNIGDALAFISEAMVYPLREVIDRRGGITAVRTSRPRGGFPQSLGLGVVLSPSNLMSRLKDNPASNGAHSVRYAFELGPLGDYDFEILREQCIIRDITGQVHWFDRNKRDAKSNIDGFTKMTVFSPSSLAMPVLGGVLPFERVQRILSGMKVYAINPSALRELQDPDSGRDLKADGRNAASVLEEIERRSPDTTKRLQKFLSAVLPSALALDTVQHGKKLAIEITQDWGNKKQVRFEAFSMSDGTLRALGLLLAVFQVTKPSLIFIDEPEASIHPGATGVILDTLRHAASTMQVVVSTQSPEILDAKWIEDKNLRSVVWRQGATRVEEIPENAKRALRTHLMGAGELLRSEALEPHPTSQIVEPPDLDLFEEIDGNPTIG